MLVSFSGGFITVIVVIPLERKLAKRTSVIRNDKLLLTDPTLLPFPERHQNFQYMQIRWHRKMPKGWA